MGKTIFSLVAVSVAGAALFLYTQPAYDGAQKINAEIAQYDTALQKAAELQKLKQSLLSRYNTFNPADIDRLQKLLPDHVDNVRLILDLDSIASRHGLALQNVAVSAPQSAQQTTQTAVGALSSSKQKYDSVTLKFSTTATYEAFTQFMIDLEQSLRIVDLTALTMSPEAEGEGGAASGPVYGFDITVRTYWLK